MIPPPVEIEDLSLAFGPRTLLRNFSLRLEPGETVVLAGPSGCGKSSLLSAILGFVAPAAGRIAICGEPLTPRSVWRLRRSLAWVQQEPDLGEQTVREWIEEPFAFHANHSLRPNLSRLPELLRQLLLPESILARQGPALSGGEKQRVALAAALLLDRPVLLLDEPVSALDPDARQAVYGILSGLNSKSLLMVSHDTGPDLSFARRIVRLIPAEAPR